MSVQPLLRMEDMSVSYGAHEEVSFRGIKAINLSIFSGQNLGVAGETGAGKSTLARAASALEPLSRGRVFLGDVCIASADPEEALKGEALRKARRDFQIMFQDPGSSLSPRMTVEMIVAEGALAHGLWEKKEVLLRVEEALAEVNLDVSLAARFPGELSGGERRRVALARVKAVQPQLLILDEPTAGLDQENVTDILSILQDANTLGSVTLMVISHDLRLLSALCERMAILHLGKIVEQGDTKEILDSPQELYTRTLLGASQGSQAWIE